MLQVFVNFILWIFNRLTGLVLAPLFMGFQTGFNFNFDLLLGNISSFVLYIQGFYHYCLSALGINNYIFNIVTGFFISYILVLTTLHVYHWFVNIYNLLKP